MKFITNNRGNLTLTFTSNINVDNGCTNLSQGTHESTMELFKDNNGVLMGIEWDNPIDIVFIGLWFDNDKRLKDYDGVFELPKQAIKLIRKAGYIVPNEFITN